MRAETYPRIQARLDILSAALALVAAMIVVFSLLEGERLWTRWLVFVPAAVASLPLVFPHRSARQRARKIAATLLVIWCLVAIASVGIFYLPSAIVMIVAAARGRHT